MKIFAAICSCLFVVACAESTASLDKADVDNTQQALGHRPRTRVLILRHAEKADPNDWNTDLATPQGVDRAQAWVDILSRYEPDTLFVSNLQRTQHTLQPTADELGTAPIVWPDVPASTDRPTVDDTRALADEILARHRGQTIVVCWHTPYVQDLAIALGVPAAEVPDWDHATYDHLWKVTIYRDDTANLYDLTPFN